MQQNGDNQCPLAEKQRQAMQLIPVDGHRGKMVLKSWTSNFTGNFWNHNKNLERSVSDRSKVRRVAIVA